MEFRDVATDVVTTRCVNTGDHSFGTSTESFNVTAPGPPGDYNVTFFAHSGNDCSAQAPAASGFTLLRRG